MPRPGSRRYYREQVRAGGLSPRPSILSPRPSTGGTSPRSRLTAATGNTRHDVRRHKANAELASIQKRISRETERRLKELYEEEFNCEFSDDKLFHEWRAETHWHRRMHGQKGAADFDPASASPFASPRAFTPREPRPSRFEYVGVGLGGAAPEPESDDDDVNAVIEAARVRREADEAQARGEAYPPKKERKREPPRNPRWNAFVASAEPITAASVPWLKRDGSRLTVAALGVGEAAPYAEKKRAVREAVLCWHPDKWTQQFGDRLDAGGDRDGVMARVTAEARNVHDLWLRLKEEGQRVRASLAPKR